MIKKTIFVIIGWICFGLGFLGIFIPVLPTTPFMLLAAAMFAKGSEKLYKWLINHSIFGESIRKFHEERTIETKVKVIAISTLWLLILFSTFFVVNERWYLQVLLLGIACGVTIYILSFPSNRKK